MRSNFLRSLFARRPVLRRAIAHVAAAVEYETFILNADGSVASSRKRKRNLILDQGLNAVASAYWTANFTSCAVGTGNNPTKRDSGAVTFTRAGTVITASAGFFVAADVGRLLKWDVTGEEVYITGYTSATVVACVAGAAIGANEGTVWYVNDTGLQTETARTASISAGAGENESTFANPTLTNKRTFLFPAVVAPVTYTEIGWSANPVAGANLFGRDLIPGLGDSLLAGQQYKVIVRLLLTMSPVVVTAVGDVGNNGFVTSGDVNHEYVLSAYSGVDSNGTTTGGALEPSFATTFNGVTSAFTLLTAPSYTNNNVGDFCRATMTNAAYTNGTFYRDSSGTVAVGSGNGSLTAIVFGQGLGGAVSRQFSLKFTSPQTKDNLHTLTVTLRKSWGRILVN